MADYWTLFSCLFDVGNAANADRARTIRSQLEEKLDDAEGATLGFEMEPNASSGPGVLWLHSGESGDPEHVITFVRRCAEAFGLTGRWGFRWALSCSRPRLDGFGGGAHVLDLATDTMVEWLDCEHWLAGQLAATSERTEGAPA